MARDSVRVSPGMLETKVMVAPNSPSALAKASAAPAARPGMASGRSTCRKVAQRRAPRLAAISSYSRGIASNDSLIARTNSGKAMTAAASTAPVQRKASSMPSTSPSQAPIAPWFPKATSST